MTSHSLRERSGRPLKSLHRVGGWVPKYVQIQAEPELEALLCIGGCPVAASDAVPGWPTTSDVACPPMLVRLKSRGRLCQPLFFLLPRESVIIPPAVLVLLDSLLTSEGYS